MTIPLMEGDKDEETGIMYSYDVDNECLQYR